MSSAEQPIRTLLVTHSLTTGGAERFVANLAGHLDRRRFAPEVFGASDGRSYPVPEDVEVATHGYEGLADLPRVAWALRRRLRREPRVDVVLSNVLSTSCLVGVARGRGGVPWVARVGLDPERGDRGPQAWLARRVYPWASSLVSNSREMAGVVERRYPRTEGRVRAIPNPVDLEAIRTLAKEEPPEEAGRSPGESVVLVVGRLRRQKRFDLAIRALARCRERRSVRLWVVGEGPEETSLRRLAAELGVGGAVDWLGFCDNPFPLMQNADLFLLSSDYEGLPNALIEAQGLGLPAVATRCPYGPSEIVRDGETGWLVGQGDAEALAAALAEALDDDARLQDFGERARRGIEESFSLPVAIPQWERLLAETALGRPGGRGGG